MAKITKDELKNKISSLVENTEVAVELLEDVEDSFEVEDKTALEEANQKLAESETKYNELLTKYKNRFTDSVEDVKEEVKEEPIGLQEEHIIDVKEV